MSTSPATSPTSPATHASSRAAFNRFASRHCGAIDLQKHEPCRPLDKPLNIVLPIVPPGPDHRDHTVMEDVMKGYVAQRRGRFYAVIYEGLDPVTGRERRRWHPAGTDRTQAEHLAAQTSTSRSSGSRSTVGSSPSATSYTRPEARPRPHVAPSTSTRPPSPCSTAGALCSPQSSPR